MDYQPESPTPSPSETSKADPSAAKPEAANASALPRHALWFAASYLLAFAGFWGVIGGWYFGLPVGGEIRQDLFTERGWALRDLFTTIPHPDFADLPFVPQQAGDGFEVREKFRSALGWSEGTLEVRVPQGPARAASAQSFSKDNAVANTKQAQVANQAARPPVFAPLLIPYFETRIASARTVLQLRNPDPASGTCLTFVRQGQNTGPCLALPHDTPANSTTTLAFPTVQITPLDLQLIDGGVFPDQPDPQLFLANYASAPRVDPLSWVYSATLGAEAGTPPSGGKQAIWVGGELGDIFRMTADANGTLGVTRLNVPGAGAIKFVAFVSSDRGWAWSAQGSERGISSDAAFQTFNGGAGWQLLSYRWLPAPWVFVAFALGAFAFERGTRARLKQLPVVPQKHIADHGVSDDPIGLNDEDALGLRPIARSMARFLRNTETKPTVAIAVTGPWGSGKTSLMNLVREELGARDVRTVWFNAWHNQKEDNLLAALLEAVRSQAVPPLWTVPGFIYRLRVAWKRIGADPNATVALLVFVGVALWIVATHLEMAASVLGQLADRIGALLMPEPPAARMAPAAGTPGTASAVTSIGLSTGGISALIYAGKKLWELFKPLKSIPAELLSTLGGQPSTKDMEQQLSFRYRFASEFAVFCDTLRRPPHPGLVIFIDDLDRCAPKQTVDILEAINFVTSAGRCFVVLGLDENKVKAAIADSYKDMTLQLDDSEPSGAAEPSPSELRRRRLLALNEFASHYLEKLIHLVVPVPRSREDTVELLLGLKRADAGPPQVETWRTVARTISGMLSTALVVALLIASAWLGVTLVTRSLPTVAASTAASSTVPSATVNGNPSSPPAVPDAPAATTLRSPLTGAPVSSPELANAGLGARGVLGTVPPAAMVAAFALFLIIISIQFLPRLQIEPVVSDSADFQEALRIWIDGITRTRETPRAIKRFVNRLRFMAMRLRDLSTEADRAGKTPPFTEAALVAMAVTGDVDEELLGAELDDLSVRIMGGGEQAEDAKLVQAALSEFRSKFGDPYANAVALPTFRLLAGLVAERRTDAPAGQDTTAATPPPA
ncbi:hypothetical protein CI1B_22210 [Bradyrhizobium ivorense]|uniref:KAP NTPase domain-containing protein n=1 Tax=Bradyrhizobium ivorense TaxID=2511166 RepID=A0A508T6C9_9BRAD|nr:P-loop NTPase fold protein [Bradyrhizobium ivorense]VIO68598.1 hypothetical protein CI1B_22210 [Bradyrhizobium ivorense]